LVVCDKVVFTNTVTMNSVWKGSYAHTRSY